MQQGIPLAVLKPTIRKLSFIVSEYVLKLQQGITACGIETKNPKVYFGFREFLFEQESGSQEKWIESHCPNVYNTISKGNDPYGPDLKKVKIDSQENWNETNRKMQYTEHAEVRNTK